MLNMQRCVTWVRYCVSGHKTGVKQELARGSPVVKTAHFHTSLATGFVKGMTRVTIFARMLRPPGNWRARTITCHICVEQRTSVAVRIVSQPSGRSTALTVVSEIVSASIEHGRVVTSPVLFAVTLVYGTEHSIIEVHETGLLGRVVHR